MEQKKINRLSREDLQYIAGFIDGDGSIIAQIVKSAEYKYGHTIRVSVVLYQKTRRYWFLKQMQRVIGGHLRKKKDGMSEVLQSSLTRQWIRRLPSGRNGRVF